MKKSAEIRIVCPECGFVHTFAKNPNKVIKKETIVSQYYHNVIDRLDKEECKKYNIPEVFIGETLLIWSCVKNISGIKCMHCQSSIESDTSYDIDAYLQPYRFDTSQCDRGDIPCTTPIIGNILAADLTMKEWGFNHGKKPRNNPEDCLFYQDTACIRDKKCPRACKQRLGFHCFEFTLIKQNKNKQ